MKIEQVLAQLQVVLPRLTDKFTSIIGVNSITAAGMTATVTTTIPHGLSIGDSVTIKGATSPIAITSITRVGTIATAVTTTDHDLTDGNQDTVTLSGANETEFNGTFVYITQTNRRTFQFNVDDAGPTIGTGVMLLESPGETFGYSGLRTVLSTPTTTTFTYALTKVLTVDAGGNPEVATGYRMTGAINFDRCLAMYTAQATEDHWIFVTLGDANVSKDRNSRSDAITSMGPGGDRRQQIFQSMSVHVFLKTSDELSARAARDEIEDIRPQLFKSLLGVKFPTQLSAAPITGGGQYGLSYLNDGFEVYTTAFYVHTFNFELPGDTTLSDTVDPDLNVAFRDISLTMLTTLGTGELTAEIDLDDEPL